MYQSSLSPVMYEHVCLSVSLPAMSVIIKKKKSVRSFQLNLLFLHLDGDVPANLLPPPHTHTHTHTHTQRGMSETGPESAIGWSTNCQTPFPIVCVCVCVCAYLTCMEVHCGRARTKILMTRLPEKRSKDVVKSEKGWKGVESRKSEVTEKRDKL